jgi:hypothetical protein
LEDKSSAGNFKFQILAGIKFNFYIVKFNKNLFISVTIKATEKRKEKLWDY